MLTASEALLEVHEPEQVPAKARPRQMVKQEASSALAGQAATGEVEEESEELREVKVEWREEQSLEGLKRRRMELDQAEEEEEQVHVPEEEEEVSQQQQELNQLEEEWKLETQEFQQEFQRFRKFREERQNEEVQQHLEEGEQRMEEKGWRSRPAAAGEAYDGGQFTADDDDDETADDDWTAGAADPADEVLTPADDELLTPTELTPTDIATPAEDGQPPYFGNWKFDSVFRS